MNFKFFRPFTRQRSFFIRKDLLCFKRVYLDCLDVNWVLQTLLKYGEEVVSFKGIIIPFYSFISDAKVIFLCDSVFLDHVKKAFQQDSGLSCLLMDNYFRDVLASSQTAWRRAVALAISNGVPVPAFTTALSYYDSFRCAKLPANLLQVCMKDISWVFSVTAHFLAWIAYPSWTPSATHNRKEKWKAYAKMCLVDKRTFYFYSFYFSNLGTERLLRCAYFWAARKCRRFSPCQLAHWYRTQAAKQLIYAMSSIFSSKPLKKHSKRGNNH